MMSAEEKAATIKEIVQRLLLVKSVVVRGTDIEKNALCIKSLTSRNTAAKNAREP